MPTGCRPFRDRPDTTGGIRCQIARWVDIVGRRSPRIRPPIADVVALTPGGFWIGTSQVVADSTTWFIADSAGTLTGSLRLGSAERPIGGFRERIAIADTTGGRTSVSWREVMK